MGTMSYIIFVVASLFITVNLYVLRKKLHRMLLAYKLLSCGHSCIYIFNKMCLYMNFDSKNIMVR